jgi:L-fuconolactonase
MPQAVVDSHIHYWQPSRLRLPWLAHAPSIARDHLPAELSESAAGVDLQGIVFVETDVHSEDQLAEAKWVAELAESEPRIQAMVASARLEEGAAAVRPHLEALARFPLVRGIRRLIQGRDPGFGDAPKFVEAVQSLPDFGFSFDICIKHHQFEEALRLVEQCPNVAFILDHFGKPDVAANLMDPWRSHLQALAAFPNTVCKISGLATEADHQHWTREQLRPYIAFAVDTFGPDRVLYGGDWPVSTQAIGYQAWIDTINWATPHLSDADRHKLFVTTARRVYRF